jgi:rhodanese-related sulfurtransferase
MGREQFVGIVAADQPDTPPYFTYDAVLNAKLRPTLEHELERQLRPLSLHELLELRDGGAQVLDTRDPADFESAHLAGSVNVGLGGSYATWCGTVLDRERPVVIVAAPGREEESAIRLGRIGFDIVAGYLDGGMRALDMHPDLLAGVERVTARALAEQLASPEPPLVVDVRTEQERSEKHITGSVSLPLSRLAERIDELPRDRQLVVHCATGYRAAIAASLLQREGFERVADLSGGIGAWDPARAAA